MIFLLFMELNNNENNDNNTNCRVINFYWQPIKEIIDIIEFFCIENKFKNILEIGPGNVPFSLATKTIGFNEKIKERITELGKLKELLNTVTEYKLSMKII